MELNLSGINCGFLSDRQVQVTDSAIHETPIIQRQGAAQSANCETYYQEPMALLSAVKVTQADDSVRSTLFFETIPWQLYCLVELLKKLTFNDPFWRLPHLLRVDQEIISMRKQHQIPILVQSETPHF